MPDQPNSTPPAPQSWEDDEGFRATMLYRFYPEDAAVLRSLARMLFDLVCEVRDYDHEPEEESQTKGQVRAALADLRYLEAYLDELGHKPERSGLELPDIRLALHAGDAALAVGRVADTLEEGLR